METVPAPLLAEVMYYLTPSEVTLSFQRISRACYQVWKEGYYQERYLLGLLRAPEEVVFLQTGLAGVIQSLARGLAKPLHFIGLATNGGVDQDSPYYWVDGAFKGLSGSGYSSREGKSNINVLAGFSSPPTTSPILDAAKQLIAQSFRSNHIIRFLGTRVNAGEDLCDRELMVYSRLWDHRPEVILMALPAEQWDHAREQINKAIVTLTEQLLQLRDLYSTPRNSMILIDWQKVKEVQQSNTLALVRKIIISREGEYTCPVRTFMLFTSLEYMDVESEEMKGYDGLTEAGMIDAVGGVEQVEEKRDWIWRILEQGNKRLRPLLWGQFRRSGKRAEFTLKYGVLCRFLHLKLIDCENHMQEMGDPNALTNIDLGSVQVFGTTISLA